MKNTIYLFLILIAVVEIAGCSKNSDYSNQQTPPPEYDTQTSQDNALAENTWNDIQLIADQSAISGALSTYRNGNEGSILSSCATITRGLSGTDTTIAVDFGSTWCHCSDGRYRKGQFHILILGSGYRNAGTVISINATALDNYYVRYLTDTNYWFKVVGSRTITNSGIVSGHPSFSISGNSTFTNNVGAGQSFTWASTITRAWIAGDTTALWTDDKYSITGTENGSSFEGTNYTVTIENSNPLITDLSCTGSTCRITKGIFDLTPEGKPMRTLDFGTGNCDTEASVSVNGQTYPVTIR